MTSALSTYRLQLTSDFGFQAAADIVPYLKELGITHVYASPFMRARSGSTHGYDVVDHNAFNPELGGGAGFDVLSRSLKEHGLGLILDFVPNHMGVNFSDNAWWLDVLEWGPKSRYARSFDIDWDLLPHRRKPGLLLPILGTSYGEALERGEIELRYEPQTDFSAHYFEHRLPIAPHRLSEIVRTTVTSADATNSPVGQKLLALAQQYREPQLANPAAVRALKQSLAAIEGAGQILARGLDAYRARNGPSQTLALHHLLERQHYRLSHWKLASSEINYRRFFDVNSLAGLRVEDPITFVRIHALVRDLIATDKIQGLRIDHIDGLLDPAQYLQRLRRLVREARGDAQRPFLILIEKILGENESMAALADCDGTTGYECMNLFSRLLLEPDGHRALRDTWRQASNSDPDFDPVLIESKRRVLETLLVSEFTVLAKLLGRIAAGHYSTRDFSEDSLRQALTLYVLHFPVYRTYIHGRRVSAADRATIEGAIARARAGWFAADDGIFNFLQATLTLDLVSGDKPLHSRQRVRRFAMKMQQFTGPLMAKSLEDTAFYRYPLLLALNEVGGNPASSPLGISQFHQAMVERAQHWPHALTSTATHDTKRGEDARMRILALSEISDDWARAVSDWKLQNARFVGTPGGQRCPSLIDEYAIYQALVGAAPLSGLTPEFIGRFQQYILKCVREEKLQSSWLNPNDAYETAIKNFVSSILDRSQSAEFLTSLGAIARRAALLGALNSLTQLTLKAAIPGIPDFYQGTELYDLAMVDPDNRRPVDYEQRKHLLHSLSPRPADSWEDGRIKFEWTRLLLGARQRHPQVFALGDYAPLPVQGTDADHVIAFSRRHEGQYCHVVALRRFGLLTDFGRRWASFSELDARVVLGGKVIQVSTILADMPAALLFNDETRVN